MNERAQRDDRALPVRREAILGLLNRLGSCSVETLASQFGVSGMTIRRDLQVLAEAGRVIRTHGGAALGDRVTFEFRFLERMQTAAAAKEAIAHAAAKHVEGARSILLDSGTTTVALAKVLRERRDLTIITTSLPIASVLQHCEAISVLLLGGVLRRDAPDLCGELTEANLEDLRADVAFIGADGVDAKGNVYNASLTVGRMLRGMAASASRVFVVADSTKIGRTALMRFGNVADWDGLITDRGLSRSQAGALRRAKVHVILADAPAARKAALAEGVLSKEKDHHP